MIAVTLFIPDALLWFAGGFLCAIGLGFVLATWSDDKW